MGRKVIYSLETEPGIADFVSNMPTVREEVVKAVGPSSRRLPSRNADALEKLRAEAIEEGIRQGFEEGRSRGYQEALATSEIEFGQALVEFRDALQSKSDSILGAIDDWYVRAEQNLAELAVAIAARILSQELRLGHDTITSLTKEALSEVRNSSTARIKVNPFDSSALDKRKSEILAACSSLRSIEIIEDPSLIGGCVIETDCGTIDASVQTQLDSIAHAIKEAA